MRGHIILSHGSDSSPDATKVSTLAVRAEASGWVTHRPDYRDDDKRGHAESVAPRIARLRAVIEGLDSPPLLVGSSMGAFASGLVSLEARVAGMLLLATPSGIPGFPQAFDLDHAAPSLFIHGWRDDVCPLPGLYAFAGKHRLPLLVLDDDHRLSRSMDVLCAQFSVWLEQMANRA